MFDFGEGKAMVEYRPGSRIPPAVQVRIEVTKMQIGGSIPHRDIRVVLLDLGGLRISLVGPRLSPGGSWREL